MEKFMFIFHGGQLPADKATPEAMQANMNEWFQWIGKLSEQGRYLQGEALLPGGKIVSGKNLVTDGPYTEGKDLVGGYFIVQAADYTDALSLVDGYPDFKQGGRVQVRQVMKIDMPE
jgi:hypothetical protein